MTEPITRINSILVIMNVERKIEKKMWMKNGLLKFLLEFEFFRPLENNDDVYVVNYIWRISL